MSHKSPVHVIQGALALRRVVAQANRVVVGSCVASRAQLDAVNVFTTLARTYAFAIQ